MAGFDLAAVESIPYCFSDCYTLAACRLTVALPVIEVAPRQHHAPSPAPPPSALDLVPELGPNLPILLLFVLPALRPKISLLDELLCAPSAVV